MATDRELLDELHIATRTFVTMVRKAGELVDERFQGMVDEPLANVEEVLGRLPQPGKNAWDGSLRDEDIEVEYYEPGFGGGMSKRGCRLRHRITGIVRESYSKRTQEENYIIARNSLAVAVSTRYLEMA